jgi:nucleoside-diphosphate-sugar epimerase
MLFYERLPVFVTGSSGFIGRALNSRLKAVSGYDLSEGQDVTDYDSVYRAMEGCGAVVHCAAIAGIDRTLAHPTQTMRVILEGTANVYRAALAHGVEMVLNLSTSEVFGSQAYNRAEGDPTSIGRVGEARWGYSCAKLAMEHLGYGYYKEFGLPIVSVRPFNVFGPGQVGEGAVHTFITRALRGEPLFIYNGGTQIRSWIYIDDFIDGLRLCLNPALGGETFNIGNPRNSLSITQLAAMIVELTGSDSEIILKEEGYADVELRQPCIKKIEGLGFFPKTDLSDGLRKTIEFYRS